MKRLPVVLKGCVSKIKLIIADNNIKFSMPIFFTNLKFLKIKTINNKAIKDIITNPTTPVSVKISK